MLISGEWFPCPDDVVRPVILERNAWGGRYFGDGDTLTNIGLIATLHDPEGRMSAHLPLCMPWLKDVYDSLVVVATPSSARQTTEIIERSNAEVYRDASEHIGVSRRRAIELGLVHSKAEHFHYCDFDRLIHWVLHYPDELRQVVLRVLQQSDFLVIGRTVSAFDTHPEPQRETEALTNFVFSFVYGRTMDVTAGSCGMSRRAAEKILSVSTELSNATDTEWPMIIQRIVCSKLGLDYILDYVKVQGLEFENPTFFGKDASLRANTTENWCGRVRLCRKSIEAAIRVSEHFRDDTEEDVQDAKKHESTQVKSI